MSWEYYDDSDDLTPGQRQQLDDDKQSWEMEQTLFKVVEQKLRKICTILVQDLIRFSSDLIDEIYDPSTELKFTTCPHEHMHNGVRARLGDRIRRDLYSCLHRHVQKVHAFIPKYSKSFDLVGLFQMRLCHVKFILSETILKYGTLHEDLWFPDVEFPVFEKKE